MRPTVTNAYPDCDEITIRTSDGTEIDISRQEDGEVVIVVEYQGKSKRYVLGEDSRTLEEADDD